VDPTQDAPDAVPRGQRRGSFTAGPDGVETPAAGNGSAEGEGADGGTLTAAVRVPHLAVTPASPGAATGPSDIRPPDPGARDANVDRETLLSQFRTASLSPIPNIGVVAEQDLPDPEAPFPGRAVYTLAVNMPNINSYSGSWIIEFAEAKNAEILAGKLQPPSPRLKVDPVYPRDAIDERIEGDVVLHAMISSDGLVDHIQVLKRLDGRLDRSAQTALAKWRFNPATKNGVPVDIETVVRIPFRLTPRDDKRP
jgi:TonB family protein